jgi:amidohydrolase
MSVAEILSGMKKDLKGTVTKIAESAGATAELSIENKTLITYNNPDLVKKMLPSLQRAAGEENVTWMDAMTGSDPKTAFPHHTPDFYIDESGFKTGVKAFCQLVIDYSGSY